MCPHRRSSPPRAIWRAQLEDEPIEIEDRTTQLRRDDIEDPRLVKLHPTVGMAGGALGWVSGPHISGACSRTRAARPCGGGARLTAEERAHTLVERVGGEIGTSRWREGRRCRGVVRKGGTEAVAGESRPGTAGEGSLWPLE